MGWTELSSAAVGVRLQEWRALIKLLQALLVACTEEGVLLCGTLREAEIFQLAPAEFMGLYVLAW